MKRLLAALLFVVLSASPALAVIANVGALGTANSTSAGTTVVVTTSAACEVGNECYCGVVGDNIETTDGASTNITVTDSGGNTWSRLIEITRDVGGIAGNGVVVGIFKTRPSTQIANGGTITATFSSTITSKVIICHEASATAALALPASGGTGNAGSDNGDVQNIALSGLASLSRLYVRLEGAQNNNVTSCWSAVSTSFTATATAVANSGSSATSIIGCMEYRINTSTGETSAPAAAGANITRHGVMVGLQESAGASQRGRPIFFP